MSVPSMGYMQSTYQEQPTEGASASEQLHIRLGLMFVFEGDHVLDLFELGTNPWIVLVSMCMDL